VHEAVDTNDPTKASLIRPVEFASRADLSTEEYYQALGQIGIFAETFPRFRREFNRVA